MKIVVLGTPVPQGSKNVYQGHSVEANKNTMPWRESIITQCIREGIDGTRLDGPVMVACHFTFPRPKKHYRTGANAHLLRDDAPVWKTSAPDVDKLCRAVLDSLTQAGVIVDDARVVLLSAGKKYTEGTPCAVITIDTVGEAPR
jgi:Holliday junction resolvase RusA-like endonuclease